MTGPAILSTTRPTRHIKDLKNQKNRNRKNIRLQSIPSSRYSRKSRSMDKKMKLKRLVTEPPLNTIKDPKNPKNTKSRKNDFVKSVSFDRSYDKVIENGTTTALPMPGGSGSNEQFDSSIRDKISIRYGGSYAGMVNKS